jgi:hypothetical protein
MSSPLQLFNGGTAGVIWMMIITWIFVLAMIASLAEMASMAPTAGGQYHWVSEFAPPSFQKSLSYIVGTLRTELRDCAQCTNSMSRMVCGRWMGQWHSRMCANAFKSCHWDGPPRVSRRGNRKAMARHASDDALVDTHGWIQHLPGTTSASR